MSGGLGTGGGLTKATAGALRAIQAALGRPCLLHPDRAAVAVVSPALSRPQPVCGECAVFAREHGYSVLTAADLALPREEQPQ